MYGHGIKYINLELDYNNFEKVLKEAGESTLIDLSIDGKEIVKVLIADIQYDPLKHTLSHIDLKQIKMDEKVTANVALEFIGESLAVKKEAGVLVQGISELEIRCLPADLIHEIKVDISGLDTFNDVITIKDLAISDKVEILGHDLDDAVATVAPPKIEAEPTLVEIVEGEDNKEGEDKKDEGGKEDVKIEDKK